MCIHLAQLYVPVQTGFELVSKESSTVLLCEANFHSNKNLLRKESPNFYLKIPNPQISLLFSWQLLNWDSAHPLSSLQTPLNPQGTGKTSFPVVDLESRYPQCGFPHKTGIGSIQRREPTRRFNKIDLSLWYWRMLSYWVISIASYPALELILLLKGSWNWEARMGLIK